MVAGKEILAKRCTSTPLGVAFLTAYCLGRFTIVFWKAKLLFPVGESGAQKVELPASFIRTRGARHVLLWAQPHQSHFITYVLE